MKMKTDDTPNMEPLGRGLQMAAHTKELATRAAGKMDPLQSTCRVAHRRVLCPVDYMRYAEFEAVLRCLPLVPRMSVLDVSSPQWFSLCLAHHHPEVNFTYINITDNEIKPFADIAKTLGLQNMAYEKDDVRGMRFGDGVFDRVVSISVIEHVYPEEGGDGMALSDIHRVLKPGGELLLTVPYKKQGRIVYKEGAVYERPAERRNFYAREYDKATFRDLVGGSPFSVRESWMICELPGVFAPDYYEWGPGKEAFGAKTRINVRKRAERLMGKRFDELLARRYLRVAREPEGRLVNIMARLKKT